MTDCICIHEKDNVATVVRPISAGQTLEAAGCKLIAADDIPVYHKIALCAIPAGAPVYKYGEIIGTAAASIMPGQWVHIHNLDSNRGRGDKA